MREFSWFRRRVRVMAAAVLTCFVWTALEADRFVVWAQTIDAGAAAVDPAFQVMNDAVSAIETRLDEIDGALAAGRDTSAEVAALDAPTAALDAADAGVRGALEAIERRLVGGGAPQEALQRHAEFVASYEGGLRAVRDHLAAVRQGSHDDLKPRVDRARGYLKERSGRVHTPLNPQELPRRQAKPKERPPRLRLEEFTEQPPLQVASAGSAFELLAAQETAADDPSAYLAETVDAPFSQGIRDLSTSLDGSPVAIYNWVRQNIALVPTWGSIQGAEECRVSRECNAHDTASLLVALLRVSGVPARYVVGTVELPPDLFRRAVGDFPDVTAAARLASSGGIPVTVVDDGAGRTVAVRMEHVWIEAHVDYVPSRGRARGAGDTWVPLDAALKPARFQAPLIPTAAGLDPQAIYERLRATATSGDGGHSLTAVSPTAVNTELANALTSMKAYIDTNRPDATIGDLYGSLTTVAPAVAVLPASLPGRVLVAGARLATLPAASRHHLTLQITDQFGLAESMRVERSTVQLAGRRLTLAFVPATAADVATIESFGGLYRTPAYLVNLRPVVYLDAVPLGAGAPVRMGSTQRVSVAFREADGATDTVEHHVSAGTFAAVGLDLQRVTREGLDARRQKLNATRADIGVRDLKFDDMMGEILHLNAQTYFFQVEATNRITANGLNVVSVKRPAEMLATFAPSFAFVFGAATTVTRTGMNVDVRRYIVSVSSREGDHARELDYMFATGSFASAAEHTIFEYLQNARSVSAIQLIAEATNRGIPVYSIDAANAATLLPQLRVSSAVLSDVRNSVAAGKQVLIPRDEMSFLQWRGSGYIVLEPDTGAAGYMISGGLAGGGTAEPSSLIDMLSDFLSALGAFLDEFSYVATGIKALAKAAAWVEGIGPWLTGISGIVSAIGMYTETGSVIKALVAGVADVALSLAAGAAIAYTIGMGFGLIATVITIAVIALAFYLIGSIIAEIIKSVLLFDRRRGLLARALERLRGAPDADADLGWADLPVWRAA